MKCRSVIKMGSILKRDRFFGRVAQEVSVKMRHFVNRSGKQKSSYEKLKESPKYK
jgi:hypothetical protein